MQRGLMSRILVFDHTDAFVAEIDPMDVLDAYTKEKVNGEHSLTLVTTEPLEKTNRVVMCDSMGLWHEWVVLGIEAEHEGALVSYEHYCVWSLQYDLSATYIDDQFGCGVVPGHPSVPQSPRRALECALEGTTRWQIGTITTGTYASASFYRRNGWEGLQTVVERWGGELTATITVGPTGVTGRAVNLLEHQGNGTPLRRFDYGFDVSGIRRTVSDDIWPCRIVPLGKSQETEEGGYTRRPSIASVNGGIPWVEDASAVPLTRVPDGNGGWEYPTAIIKNDTYEDPSDLLAWAREHVGDYTRPIVSYEATLAQFQRAGLGSHGVALGDEVVVVDRTFGDEGLRISARVVGIRASLLDPSDVTLTIGNADVTLADQLADLATSVAALEGETASASQWRSTADYMSALIGRLNAEANATGGYTYITEGQGVRTYSVPVSDPIEGAEAKAAVATGNGAVVEVKGGTIRIANSLTSTGDWDWKTVFSSGYVATDVLTASNITTGYLSADLVRGGTLVAGGANNANGIIQVQDANGNVISQFDNSGATIVGNVTMRRYYKRFKDDVGNPLTDPYIETKAGLSMAVSNQTLYDLTGLEPTSTITSGYLTGLKVSEYTRYGVEGGYVAIFPAISQASATVWNSIGSSADLVIRARLDNSSSGTTSGPAIKLGGGYISLLPSGYVPSGQPGASYTHNWMAASSSSVGIYSRTSSGAAGASVSVSTDTASIGGRLLTVSSTSGSIFNTNLTVRGTKSRVVDTAHYGQRIMHAYETAAPYFGDIGSGVIGEDGTCAVNIDPIFAEMANTGMAYQVFLQACGDGALHVAEKRPTHFVVAGTPGLSFDWEAKAHQLGYEHHRLDDKEMNDDTSWVGIADTSLEDAYGDGDGPDPTELYEDELAYASMMESIYG